MSRAGSQSPTDFVELAPLDAAESHGGDKPESNRILRLGLLFLGLVIALVVGLSALSGGSDSSDEEAQSDTEDVAQAEQTPDAPSIVTQLNTEEDGTEPPGDDDGDEAQTGTTEVELDAFDALTGYLVIDSNFGFDGARYVRLPDGVEVGIAQSFNNPRSIVTELGSATPGVTGSDWTYLDPQGTAVSFQLGLDERVEFMTEDAEAGVLLGIMTTDTYSLFSSTSVQMLQPLTGERRALDLPVELAQQNPHLGNRFGRDPNYSALAVNIGASIFRWKWDSGWTELAPGFIDVANQGWIGATTCTGASDCERNLLSADTGEVVAPLPTDIDLSAATISPDGRYVASVVAGRTTVSQLLVLDLETDTRREIDNVSFAHGWIGDHHLASSVYGRPASVHLIDVRTMQHVELPMDLMNFDDTILAGNGFISWVPQVPLPGG